MTRYDNFHSVVVAWLKVLLPLLALAILSTLFLVSRTIDPSDAIPFAEVDVAERVREPRLTTPTWAGVTDDGAALTVAADEARPATSDGTGASAKALVANLETPDGASAEMVAASGALDTDTQILTLIGDVVVSTSTGFLITSDEMSAALDRTLVTSKGPVTATGPLGRIDAGAMEISESPVDAGLYVLIFKGGVNLLYQPAK